MTQHKTVSPRTPAPAIAWLQPVRLPPNAWAEFSRDLNESLEELERRHSLPYGLSPYERKSGPDKPR